MGPWRPGRPGRKPRLARLRVDKIEVTGLVTYTAETIIAGLQTKTGLPYLRLKSRRSSRAVQTHAHRDGGTEPSPAAG
jgi:hypothetical protein